MSASVESRPERDLLSVPIPGCICRRQSLTILSQDGFRNAGRALAEYDECAQWLWADLLLYAEKFSLPTPCDEMRPDLHVSRINSFVRTGRFFSPKDRHPDLKFTHHEAIVDFLGMDGSILEARKWLNRAAEGKWTCGELREAMRANTLRDEGDPGPMRTGLRITDFLKISRFCSTVKTQDLPEPEKDEIRRTTGPLYAFLCEIHRPKFGT